MFVSFVLFAIISTALGNTDLGDEKNIPLEKSRMLGIDAIHSYKIDKDTIISRNLKLEKKKTAKNVHKSEQRDPDWSYNSIPRDLSAYVTDFKRNMSECLKETQDRQPVKRLSPKQQSPVHGPCLIACVFKRSKVIDNGKVNKDNLISLVGKFFAKDTKLMKKLEKNLDRCVEISARHHDDECKLASQLNDCTNDLMASNKHKIVVNY